jgi:hypothetical protein
MKPYLLSIYSKTPNIQRFLDMVRELEVEHLNICQEAYAGNKGRYKHVPQGLDTNRHIIFTDTEDVIFQTAVPDLDGICVAPENEIHNNSYWKPHCKEALYKPLKNKPIYNGGSYAMPVSLFYNLVAFINSHDTPEWSDQLLLNLWLQDKHFSSDLSLFCPLYNNLDTTQCYKKDGHWYTYGKKIFCVHANGNRKHLL